MAQSGVRYISERRRGPQTWHGRE